MITIAMRTIFLHQWKHTPHVPVTNCSSIIHFCTSLSSVVRYQLVLVRCFCSCCCSTYPEAYIPIHIHMLNHHQMTIRTRKWKINPSCVGGDIPIHSIPTYMFVIGVSFRNRSIEGTPTKHSVALELEGRSLLMAN